jgi:hypothetical protein
MEEETSDDSGKDEVNYKGCQKRQLPNPWTEEKEVLKT